MNYIVFIEHLQSIVNINLTINVTFINEVIIICLLMGDQSVNESVCRT